MNEVVGYVLAVTAAAAFGYFLYTRVQASKAKKSGGGSGGGSGGSERQQRK